MLKIRNHTSSFRNAEILPFSYDCPQTDFFPTKEIERKQTHQLNCPILRCLLGPGIQGKKKDDSWRKVTLPGSCFNCRNCPTWAFLQETRGMLVLLRNLWVWVCFIWDAAASCCPNNPYTMLRCSPTSKARLFDLECDTSPAWENSSNSPHLSGREV